MKKKLFSFIVAFAFILTAGICLTACGGGGGDGSPNFQYIVIERNEESTYSLVYGNYPVDSTGPIFNHKVYANYSDGSKTELSASELSFRYYFKGNQVSELPSIYDEVGTWSIDISYNNATAFISFSIVPKSTNYTINGQPSITYPDTAPELSINDETATEDDIEYYYIERSKIANVASPTEEELEDAVWYYAGMDIKPGNYYVYAEVSAHGKFAAGRSALKVFNVAKGTLKIEGYNKADYSNLQYDFGREYYSDTKPTLANVRFVSTNQDVDGCNIHNNGVYINAKVLGADPEDSSSTLEIGLILENESKVIGFNEYGNGKTEKIGLDFSTYYGDSTLADYFNIPSGWTAWDATVTVVRGEMEIPEIEFYVDDDGVRNLVLTSDRHRNDMKFFDVKKDGNPLTFDDSAYETGIMSLDTITGVGTHTYTLILKDKENYIWEIVTKPEADSSDEPIITYSTEDRELTWEVEEFNLTNLKWEYGGEELEDGHQFTVENGAYYAPWIAFPNSFSIFTGAFKYYKADGTFLGEEVYPEEIGDYYAIFDKTRMSDDGHYHIVGDVPQLNFSIVAA